MKRTNTSPIQDLPEQIGIVRYKNYCSRQVIKCNSFACDPILYKRNSASHEIFLLNSFICCKLATTDVVILTGGPSLKNLHM